MSRKALLIAALVAVVAGRSQAGVFADVPFTHWAYQAVEKLASVGVLEGYPDGKFRGPQPMTRYEFAVALVRAYDWMKKTIGVDPAIIDRLTKGQQDLDGRLTALATKHDADMRLVGGRVDGLGTKLNDEVKRLDGRIDGLKPVDLKPVNDRIDALDAKVAADGKRIDGNTTAINDLAAKHDKDIADAKAATAAVATSVGKVETRTKALEDAVAALQKLTGEFDKELKALGADTAKMKTDLTALQGRVTALEGRVNNHEARLAALERIKVYGDLGLTVAFDGSPNAAGGRDGDLKFESGEASMALSARVGVDFAISDTQAARVTLWYDSDNNRFHGASARQAGMASLGIDEAWVKTPGLGGRWIFGRQYAGQDYETGEAKCALGLGTGYYTGAALTGIRGQYNLGKHVTITGLVQADDNTSPTALVGGVVGANAANLTGIARGDISLPWLKDKAGKDGVKIGIMSVGNLPNNNAAIAPAAGAWKLFNDGTGSREFSISADLHVNVLKGLDVEYTNQYRQANGTNPDVNLDGNANAQSVYAKLGVLNTPTFKLSVAGGVVAEDESLSYSIFNNPYQANALGTANSLFTRPNILGSFVSQPVQGAPTQGFDVNFTWNLGNRPLNVRWAGSTRRADLFNWMVYGEYPLVETGAGNVKVGLGFIDVDPGHPLGGNTVAANLSAGFRF